MFVSANSCSQIRRRRLRPLPYSDDKGASLIDLSAHGGGVGLHASHCAYQNCGVVRFSQSTNGRIDGANFMAGSAADTHAHCEWLGNSIVAASESNSHQLTTKLLMQVAWIQPILHGGIDNVLDNVCVNFFRCFCICVVRRAAMQCRGGNDARRNGCGTAAVKDSTTTPSALIARL